MQQQLKLDIFKVRERTEFIRSAVDRQQAASIAQLKDLGLLDGDRDDVENRGDGEAHVMAIAEVIYNEIEEFSNQFAPRNGARRRRNSSKKRSMKYTVGNY